jgi:hypothetical protein
MKILVRLGKYTGAVKREAMDEGRKRFPNEKE